MVYNTLSDGETEKLFEETKMMYVTYSNRGEVIVSTLDDEEEMKCLYFIKGGRVLEDFDRETHVDPVSVMSSVNID